MSAGSAGRAVSPHRSRDLRLDFFRGLGLFIILIAHITDNPWTLYIPARFGFSDATEIFVFCSGMASAIAFGAVFERAGWVMGSLRIIHRMWQVYWVHICVFLTTLVALFVVDHADWTTRDQVRALNLQRFMDDPGPNLVGLMSLTYVPNYFDILPMYLVILALIPMVMALARIDPRLAVLASLALWAVAGNLGLNLPAELWGAQSGDRPWFFNPFAWQLVFFAGFALMARWLPPPPVERPLVFGAAGFLVLTIPFAWHETIDASQFVRDWRQDWAALIDKTDLGPLRVMHFFALAYLAWAAAGEGGRRLSRDGPIGAVVSLFSRVGRQSLAVFAASMVAARLLGAALDVLGRGPMATLLVNLAGFALIVGVAAVVEFFKGQPWRAVRQAPGAGDGLVSDPTQGGSGTRTAP
jgi:hypothetical protein